jgi:hypothetical protein
MRNIRHSLAVSTVLFTFSTPVLADEHEIVLQSARHYARGNTYVAAFDSDEATRANPATLAEADKIRFQIRWLQADAFVSQNAIDTASDLVDISSSDAAGFEFLDAFAEQFGKRQSARLQVAPLGIRILQAEVSPFAYTNNYLDIRTPTLPEFSIYSDTVAGANLSFGKNFGKNVMGGVTLRPFYRMYIDGGLAFADVTEMAAPNASIQLDEYLTQADGMGLSADFGAIWKVSPKWRLGILSQNLGGSYYFSQGANRPPNFRQTLNIGSHTRYALGKSSRLDFLADFHDVQNQEHHAWMRHFNFGTELGTTYFTRDSDAGIAMGLNEGYLCMGAFADFWLFRLDIANYAVELAETAGQRMDRRWAISTRITTTL